MNDNTNDEQEGLPEGMEDSLRQDRAVAQSLASAITSRGNGDYEHTMFVLIATVMYVSTINGLDLDELIDEIKAAAKHFDGAKVEKIVRHVIDPFVNSAETGDNKEGTDEQDELPKKQNAPSTKSIN